jgi:hypothetical protein
VTGHWVRGTEEGLRGRADQGGWRVRRRDVTTTHAGGGRRLLHLHACLLYSSLRFSQIFPFLAFLSHIFLSIFFFTFFPLFSFFFTFYILSIVNFCVPKGTSSSFDLGWPNLTTRERNEREASHGRQSQHHTPPFQFPPGFLTG